MRFDIEENKFYKKMDDMLDKVKNGSIFDGNNSVLIKKLLFEEQKHMHIRSKEIKICSCPDCNEKSIKKSHTIPKKMALDFIAENKNVIIPYFIEKYPVDSCYINVMKIGVGIASTFPGFCRKHEMIFQSFEKKCKIETEEDVIKQIFRNVAYNCFLWEKRKEHGECLVKKYMEIRNQASFNYVKAFDTNNVVKRVKVSGDDKKIMYLRHKNDEIEDFLGKIEICKEKLWKQINGKEVDIVCMPSVIDIVIPVGICCCTEILFEGMEYICSVDVVPNSNTQTFIALTFYSEIPKELRNIIEMRLNHPLGILNLIESTMIYGTDNWYLKPKVWDILDKNRQYKLLEEMQNTDKCIFDEVPYSIFDDIRRHMIDTILVNEDIEHELKKMCK